MHGSLSSLPSSIMSSRPGRDKRRVIDDRVRKGGRDNGKVSGGRGGSSVRSAVCSPFSAGRDSIVCDFICFFLGKGDSIVYYAVCSLF